MAERETDPAAGTQGWQDTSRGQGPKYLGPRDLGTRDPRALGPRGSGPMCSEPSDQGPRGPGIRDPGAHPDPGPRHPGPRSPGPKGPGPSDPLPATQGLRNLGTCMQGPGTRCGRCPGTKDPSRHKVFRSASNHHVTPIGSWACVCVLCSASAAEADSFGATIANRANQQGAA
jgi:hypothetical protein